MWRVAAVAAYPCPSAPAHEARPSIPPPAPSAPLLPPPQRRHCAQEEARPRHLPAGGQGAAGGPKEVGWEGGLHGADTWYAVPSGEEAARAYLDAPREGILRHRGTADQGSVRAWVGSKAPGAAAGPAPSWPAAGLNCGSSAVTHGKVELQHTRDEITVMHDVPAPGCPSAGVWWWRTRASGCRRPRRRA